MPQEKKKEGKRKRKKSNIGRYTRGALRVKQKRRKQRDMMNFQRECLANHNFGLHFLASNSVSTDPLLGKAAGTEPPVSQHLSDAPPSDIQMGKDISLTDSQNKGVSNNLDMDVNTETQNVQTTQNISPTANIHVQREFHRESKSTTTEISSAAGSRYVTSITIESVFIKQELDVETEEC